LFAGFYADRGRDRRQLRPRRVAIFGAMLFDGLDGRVARWTHTESLFGKEYDSLSDMVAFASRPRSSCTSGVWRALPNTTPRGDVSAGW